MQSVAPRVRYGSAWMSGIPVVVLDGRSSLPQDWFKFAEVTSLIKNGVDGIVATSATQAREVLSRLLADKEYARSIGSNGRRSAISAFGVDHISRQWDDFLSEFRPHMSVRLARNYSR